MPSTGTPSAKMFLSGNGAFLAYTLDGPPDKMMPLGASAAISTAGVSWPRMTEYTLHSRMRRAITWVYCDPKSKITICYMIDSNKNGLFARRGKLWRDKKQNASRFWPAILGNFRECAAKFTAAPL